MIAIVTDSASMLPPALRTRYDITVVPITITIDGRDHAEGVDLTTARFYEQLAHGAAVTTAAPSPGAFVDIYRAAAAADEKAVLSVHTGAGVERPVRAGQGPAVPLRSDERAVGDVHHAGGRPARAHRVGGCSRAPSRARRVPAARARRPRDRTGAERGFVKLIAAPKYLVGHTGGGRVVGATIVAPTGGELIHEAALAMETNMFVGRLAQTTHAYPTWAMAVQQAALQFFGPSAGLQARPVSAQPDD
jgi:hypothetical protein